MTMLRSNLVAELRKRYANLPAKAVEELVDTVFDEVVEAMAAGKRVEIRGFGAFSCRERQPRTGRNPRTGEAVAVTAKRVPFFKPGKGLRDRVNAASPPVRGGGADR